MSKTRVLVLCTGNSCRSQIMHGFLKQNGQLEVYSAGVSPHGVNPKAVATMAEIDIDISDHTSNHVNEYMEMDIDYVVTVCDSAKENCPYFPPKVELIHRDFEDPSHATGTEEEIKQAFRDARDQIGAYSAELSQQFKKQE